MANSAIASADVRARVDAIISERDSRRRRLATWQREALPDTATSEDEWKRYLDPMEFKVLRLKGTEPRGGEYDSFYPPAEDGHFACRGCSRPLYSAAAKFKSGCGWPAFDKCYMGAVAIREDRTLEPLRIEIMCAGCDGHLGHVFAGERMTPTNERHCVNSVSVLFIKGLPARVLPGCSTGVDALPEETLCSMRNLAKLRKL